MHRTLALGASLAALPAGIVLVSELACGNLIIPVNAGDDGGGDDDASGNGDDSADARPPANCDAGVEPVALACTGLYSNWTQLILAPDVQPYTPGAQMWVDGASAQRWIWLPPGSKIDSSDLNNWSFPVGTKIWQELSLLGKRIETRFLWKEAAYNWFRTTFAWTEDQSAAPTLTIGQLNARGLPYEIPSVSECGACHDGAADFALGFEIVSLGMAQSAGLNLQALTQKQLLTNPPSAVLVVPGPDTTTIGSLSFLHANCGTSCHNRGPDASGGATGLFLKLTVDVAGALPATAQLTDTWTTAYDVPSMVTPYGIDAGGFWRIRPADTAHSSVAWLVSRRDGVNQMPPIATHLEDQNDVQLLNTWIGAMQPAGQ